MLLRRVIEHVKAQNWTAVVLDFLIVVMGVFIGIQVSNLNAARHDRADEKLFLQRLHDDVETADALSKRVRKRRLDYLQDLRTAANVIYDGERDRLTTEECMALSVSHVFNVTAPELPSFAELVSSGRLDIIRDVRLRAELLRLQQTREGLLQYTSFYVRGAFPLNSRYPALVQLRSYYDETLQEMQSEATCNVDAMRKTQAFKNDFSQNVDLYDAFIRDGLAPWNERLGAIHALLDDALGLGNEGTEP